MRGVLLDPATGRPSEDGSGMDVMDVLEERASREARFQRILDYMKRGNELAGPFEPRNSMQSWREIIYATVADGTQILNSTTETIMVPDYTLAGDFLYQGRWLKYTLFFNVSFVITTPGTLTFRLRWGGVAGTVLAASGAYAPDPTSAQTTRSGSVEYYLQTRAKGAAGSAKVMGRLQMNDVDDATVTTIKGNLEMSTIPVSAPAAVTINTLTANALSPTAQFSVVTATTQLTCDMAILEALT